MNLSSKVDLGSINIHKQVLEEIIQKTIVEIDGVSLGKNSLSGKIFSVFGAKKIPGVDIKINDNSEVTLNLDVYVRYGLNIPDIARIIQDAVKSAIEKSLEVNLKDVNVNIQGIERGTK